MTAGTDFWSRRRAGIEAERVAEAREAEAARKVAVEQAAAARTDEEVLAELGLPDPDVLGPGDDFAGFMARGVPEHLRRRALRKLWTSNPVLACVDGLNDYDGDFTNATAVLTGFKTAYQIGRGYVVEAAEADPSDVAPPSAEPDGEASVALIAAPDTPADAVVPDDATQTAAMVTMDGLDEPQQPAPRRMRFSFADGAA